MSRYGHINKYMHILPKYLCLGIRVMSNQLRTLTVVLKGPD